MLWKRFRTSCLRHLQLSTPDACSWERAWPCRCERGRPSGFAPFWSSKTYERYGTRSARCLLNQGLHVKVTKTFTLRLTMIGGWESFPFTFKWSLFRLLLLFHINRLLVVFSLSSSLTKQRLLHFHWSTCPCLGSSVNATNNRII